MRLSMSHSFQVELEYMFDVGLLLFFMMVVCNYLPGGRLAGQVSLQDSLEFDLENKIVAMKEEGDKKY